MMNVAVHPASPYQPAAEPAPGADLSAGALRLGLQAILLLIDRRRQRNALRELALLDAHRLDDIGLTAEQALSEADKPFWR